MRSFGPSVHYSEGKFERASCSYCIFRNWRSGQTMCTHTSDAKPIPDTENTPDFCTMLAGALRDAEQMNARDMARPRTASAA